MRFDKRSLTCGVLFLSTLTLLVGGCKSDQEKVAEHMDRATAFIEEGKDNDAIIELRSALAVDPQDAAIHYELAKAYVRTKNGQAAVWELKETVRLDPDNDEARRSLGGIALASGDYEEALKQADEAISRDYSLGDAYLIRSRALEEMGRIEEAESALRAALDVRPDDPGYLLMLSGFYERRGDKERAEALIRKMIELEPGYESYVTLAFFLRRAGDRRDEALEAFDRALDLAKDNQKHVIYSTIAHYYEALDEPEKVVETLEEGIEKAHIKQPLIIQLTQFHRMQGENEKADALIQSVTEDRRPDNPEPHLTLSTYRSNRGDPDGALAAAEAALAADPEHVRSRLRKAELLIEIGHLRGEKDRIEEGAAIVDGVLAENPENANAHFVRGKQHLAEGDVRKSVKTMRAALALKPDWPQAHMLLGSMLIDLGDIQAARAELAKAIELDAGLLEARRLMAIAHSNLGEHEYAVEQARVYLRVRPGHAETRLLLAQNLAMLGRRDDAKSEIEAIAEEERDVQVVYALGKLAQAAGDYDDARKYLLEAYELMPANAEVLASLLTVDSLSGKLDETEARLAAALVGDPDNGRIVALQARVHVIRRQVEEAVAAYNRAIELDPGDRDSYLFLGDILRSQKQNDAALKVYAKAVAQFPDEGLFFEKTAITYGALGDEAKAAVNYSRALELNPRLAVSKNNLAYLLADTGGDLDRALVLAKEARELRPKDPGAADTLGWVLVKRGRADEAIAYFKEAEKSYGDDDLNVGITRHHLAIAYEAAGSPEKAVAVIDKALAELERQLEDAGETSGEPTWAADLRRMAERLKG